MGVLQRVAVLQYLSKEEKLRLMRCKIIPTDLIFDIGREQAYFFRYFFT